MRECCNAQRFFCKNSDYITEVGHFEEKDANPEGIAHCRLISRHQSAHHRTMPPMQRSKMGNAPRQPSPLPSHSINPVSSAAFTSLANHLTESNLGLWCCMQATSFLLLRSKFYRATGACHPFLQCINLNRGESQLDDKSKTLLRLFYAPIGCIAAI